MKNILEYANIPKKDNRGFTAIVYTVIGIIIAVIVIVTNLSTIWSPSSGLGNTTTGAPAWVLTTIGIVVAAALIIGVMALIKKR